MSGVLILLILISIEAFALWPTEMMWLTTSVCDGTCGVQPCILSIAAVALCYFKGTVFLDFYDGLPILLADIIRSRKLYLF